MLTRSNAGPIVDLAGTVDATFENLTLSGATGSSGDGTAIRCSTAGGTPLVTVIGSTIQLNAGAGIFSQGCPIVALSSTFTKNGGPGAEIIDANATLDRCLISENASGLVLDSGVFTVTNNFIVRNYRAAGPTYGISMYSSSAGNRVEFNTIADNADGDNSPASAGFECGLQGMSGTFPNNIIVRNKMFQTSGSTCSYPSSIIQSDVTGLSFRSPDAAPYDYHLQAASIAIDAATASTLDHDFDGEARPNGAGRDVGADEYHP